MVMTLNYIVVPLQQAGLARCAAFYRDRSFAAALLAGGLVLSAMYWLTPAASLTSPQTGLAVFSLLVWQPLLEEILFRGIIQGQLRSLSWTGATWLGLSGANLMTSLIFCAFHLVHHDVLWALAVFVPSLVFGYFRDRYHDIYASIVLHGSYNAGLLLLSLFQ